MSPLLQRNPAIPSIVRKIKLYNDAATNRRKHSHSQDARVQNDLRPKWPTVTNNGHGSSIGTHCGNGHGGGIYLAVAVLIFTIGDNIV